MATIKNRNSKGLTEAEEIKRNGKTTQVNYPKKVLMTQITMMVDHSPRARYLGVQSQVGLRKHHYKQS